MKNYFNLFKGHIPYLANKTLTSLRYTSVTKK